MNLASVSLVDEVALAGGDVPLADGGVGRARVHVDVVQGGARYVLSVAPGLKKELEKYTRMVIKVGPRLRELAPCLAAA